MMADIRKRLGGLDGLIYNAGIAAMNHALLTPLDSVRRVLETNVVGTFLLCREAAKLMRSARGGRIVNLTTVAVPLRLEGESIYAASKAAVEMLTRILARELAPLGITCNAVGPTPIATDLIGGVPADKIDRLLAMQAIHRLGEPRDVANVTDFFLRPESDFITGQVLYLGGVS
jgi:3-oxoacyl-[acyl-carrier protein] reductase